MDDLDWEVEVDAQEKGTGRRYTQQKTIIDKVQMMTVTPTVKQPDDSRQPDEFKDDKPMSVEDAALLRKLVRNRLVNFVPTKDNIEVIRRRMDPNSPLYSVKTFESLHLKPELLKGIYGMGFDAPSKIQETALPALLADPPVNMIAQSQSGTGKTAAFVLTMLSRVNPKLHYTQCLCLAPTYELALQIGQVTKLMAKHMSELEIAFAVNGEKVTRGSKCREQIVIGTPGTALDWCTRLHAIDPRLINVFILDEADVMISTQGHQTQSMRIHRELNKDCQILFFSATYDQIVMDFAYRIVPDPLTIRLRREEECLDNVKQYYIICNDQREKLDALNNIYGLISIGQSMIFCQTRKTASWLAEQMTNEGHTVGLLSGVLTIKQRAYIIQRFRDGKEKVLITTNISARGIDIEQVTVVINFDLPVTKEHKPDCETYLHRIGRTGRFGKSGIAVNMVDGRQSMHLLRQIENHFGCLISHLKADDMDEIEKIGM